ncbi:hypothetical protein R6Y90_12870 [Alteromonas macleodii]|uniref:hypothetical protein n=1 Tax=Alteromonas macleodii TaxID=28108 RepID=UPI002980CD68|nr:hypothetical protein [Alteromonas macleodii]MDW5285852.1 hypothetical protein [Alteromonas macleodii]
MKKYIAALLLALTTSVSHAALIEYKYTGIDNTFDASSSLLDYINNSSSATTSNVSAFDMVNSETQSVSHISFEFDFSSLVQFTLFAGLDAFYGAEIYVNGSNVLDTEDDLWWRKTWTNSDVQSVDIASIGLTTIDVVWAEECCGGLSSIAFSSDLLGGDLLVLTDENIQALNTASSSNVAQVHEPSVLLLSLVGAFFIGARRFKR